MAQVFERLFYRLTKNIYSIVKLTEVEQVHYGVYNALYEDENSSYFMEVYVLIQWQKHAEPMCTQECDALAQHQYEYKRAVEVQALSCNITEHTNMKCNENYIFLLLPWHLNWTLTSF